MSQSLFAVEDEIDAEQAAQSELSAEYVRQVALKSAVAMSRQIPRRERAAVLKLAGAGPGFGDELSSDARSVQVPLPSATYCAEPVCPGFVVANSPRPAGQARRLAW